MEAVVAAGVVVAVAVAGAAVAALAAAPGVVAVALVGAAGEHSVNIRQITALSLTQRRLVF